MKNKFLLTLLLSSASLWASPAASDGYIAHEWGTFTSVQGADGVQLHWNPLSVAELPEFVYSVSWPEGRNGRQNIFVAKTGFMALQRMETPVIYFYADKPQKVNVSVNFPTGTITEWYPQASRANTIVEGQISSGTPARGQIAWKNLEILPRTEKESYQKDISGSHYYAARETEANPIRIQNKGKAELEKFLFYRGVASFQAPLTVKQQGDNAETLELKNTGSEPLRGLFIYQVQNGRAVWSHLDKLNEGQSRTVRLMTKDSTSLSEFHDQVAPQLTQALVKEGLYEAEAKAMVKTWDDSWFSETGTRVLYVLPSKWTDSILPLQLTPTPKETARVFVGRAELITPKVEFELLREMIRYVDGTDAEKMLAIENTRKLGLGRFAEATMRRLLNSAPKTQAFSNRSWELLTAVWKMDATPAKPLAQR